LDPSATPSGSNLRPEQGEISPTAAPAEDEFGSLGDTSTLADPAVVDDLVNNR
jgi:hypothetical protein